MSDKELIQTIQLSGDAYYYLLNGEEPLDPDNIDEAKELVSMLGDFEFISEPDPVQGTDAVEVKIALVDKHKLFGTWEAIITLCQKKYYVSVTVLETHTGEHSYYDDMQQLKPIGDAYWAEIRTNKDGSKDYLPICKIEDYEKWFSEN